jgi:hypothetical protein
MDLLNSLFGRRPASSPLQNDQPRRNEKRLLDDEPPQSREPILNAFPLSTASTPSEPLSVLQPQPQPQPVPRQNKAPVVFLAGVAFTAFSLLITRRSFARRRLTTKPSFYTNSPAHAQVQNSNVSAPMEAFEALNIATINVLSLAMLSTGGALWYFDIASMDDARRKLRGGLGVDGSGRTEGEAEEDFEEWLATVLSRKEAKERKREYEGEKEEKRRNERGRER